MTEHPSPVIAHGRYECVERIGGGQGGEVFHYRDRELRRDVAIKFSRTPTPHLDLAEEARRLARLDHPNIVRVFDLIAIDESTTGIVMPLIRGEPLAEALELPQPLPRVRRWVDQIASAIAEAHRHGTMHGDLHSWNVAIVAASGGGYPVVLDFGLSMLMGEPRAVPFPDDPHQAPEASLVFEPASDYWSLGLLSAELALGKHLTEIVAPDVLATDASTLGHAVRDAVQAVPDRPLVELIERLLAEQPERRATREEVSARVGARLDARTDEGGIGMGLAAVGIKDHHAEVWRVTARQRLEHRWFEDGGWSKWHDFEFDRPALDVAAVSGWPEHAEVFVLDRTGRVWHRWWWKEGGWAEQFSDLGRPFGDDAVKGVTALSGAEGHMDVFVEADDGRVGNLWYLDDEWRRSEGENCLNDGWWPFSATAD